MEPDNLIAEHILFPSAAYSALHNPEPTGVPVSWEQSTLNPVNRIDSLDPLPTPRWDIDGAEGDGAHFWAIPRFARGQPPRKIHVYYSADALHSPQLRVLRPSRIPMVRCASRGRTDVAHHLLRALELWSSQTLDFEKKYMALPFGSQIAVNNFNYDVRLISITLVPDYDLERQWLSLQELQDIWGLPTECLPQTIDIGQLQFKRQLHDSISLVGISGPGHPEDFVFKSHTLDVKVTYRELRNILSLPSNAHLQPRPLYLVTKRVRFGAKRGVCGFVMQYYPLGALDSVIRQHRQSLGLSVRLRWAKELTQGLIVIKNSSLRYYTDLKLDNILIEGQGTPGTEAFHGQVVLIDFEQGTPWMHWAPPEVYWINHIERLASWNAKASVREEFSTLLNSLLPGWHSSTRSATHDDFPYHNPAWMHLDQAEKSAAVVFMLGKAIWCLLEGADDIVEPVTLLSFLADRAAPGFPAFRHTPDSMRDLIRRCTSGAPEWMGQRQPFRVNNGKVYLRGREGIDGPRERYQIQSTGQGWWKQEIERARKFIDIRIHGAQNPSEVDFVAFMYRRPTLEEVLLTIETAEKMVAPGNDV